MTETIALLADRGVVEVEGNDAVDFLQSLLTNDIDQAAPDRAIFAGLLTPKGKIDMDFLIYSPSTNRFWLDCPKDSAATLARQLGLYRLRAKVAVADRSAEMAIGVSSSHGTLAPAAALLSCADPRHAALPQRHVVSIQQAMPSTVEADAGLRAYHAARIALCVPEGGVDYRYGEVFPHEVCYDLLNGVDFEKGCYVGQEVVSRMHHRGVAKTRIAGVRGGPPLPAIGAEIMGGEFPVGHLGSSADDLGIALIRLDRADETVRHGVPLHAGDVTITLRRPAWADYDVPSVETAP
jgi:folate-binding protein YgfZ